jgi:hypothetical protein
MVGMAVRDHGFVDRPGRIDMEAAKATIETGGGRQENVLGAHGFLDMSWFCDVHQPLHA